MCVCVSVFVSLFVSVRACACVCFWDDFQIIFYQISGPFWKLFGGFLEVAASRQPWPLPSRVEFHFEPFSYTFLHASWSPSWRQDRPSWSQDGAKLPNLAPRWYQDGHLRTQDGQLETIWGGILPTFWDSGSEKPDSKKH